MLPQQQAVPRCLGGEAAPAAGGRHCMAGPAAAAEARRWRSRLCAPGCSGPPAGPPAWDSKGRAVRPWQAVRATGGAGTIRQRLAVLDGSLGFELLRTWMIVSPRTTARRASDRSARRPRRGLGGGGGSAINAHCVNPQGSRHNQPGLSSGRGQYTPCLQHCKEGEGGRGSTAESVSGAG